MIRWYVDKQNKKPLYLQLRDLIIYYINTGDIQDNKTLPGIRFLAEEMGITYETVRKALRELAAEGLITMGRGKSSTVSVFKQDVSKKMQKGQYDLAVIRKLRTIVQDLYREGLVLDDIKEIVDHSYHEASLEGSKKFIIFSECNRYQIKEISKILQAGLGIDVKPVLMQDVKQAVLQKRPEEEGLLLGIITTTFHISEIRQAIGNVPLYLDTLQVRMSPETKEKINGYIRRKARIGCISLDYALSYYALTVRAEFGPDTEISLCPFEDKARVKSLLNSVDVLILSPAVFEEIQKMAPAQLPLFNFMDQVDPVSINLIKQRLSELI